VTTEKEKQRFVVKFFWLKGWRSKKIHHEPMSTLGDGVFGLFHIKIWLQRFRTGDLSCVTFLVPDHLHFRTAH
jgi:hypothetical protein